VTTTSEVPMQRASDRRVLCAADDDSARAELVRAMIAREYEVTVADTGAAALALAAHDSFAIVLAETRLPDMDGYALAALWVTTQPSTSFVLMGRPSALSGGPQAEATVAALLSKPVAIEELDAALRRRRSCTQPARDVATTRPTRPSSRCSWSRTARPTRCFSAASCKPSPACACAT
jgi:DNA-binding response OmpR family regulator